MDLEKFFDRVDHDILMSRIARRIKDIRLLKLIRRYLEAESVDSNKERVKRERGMPAYCHDSNSTGSSSVNMNRHIRNRTYGGVRGRQE